MEGNQRVSEHVTKLRRRVPPPLQSVRAEIVVGLDAQHDTDDAVAGLETDEERA